MPDFSYTVRLPDETTRVFLGPLRDVPFGLVAETGCLLVDEGLGPSHRRALEDLVARVVRRPLLPVVVAGGERAKDLPAVAGTWRQLLARGLDRSSLLVVAGGGALLDACGFVAATLLRGVPLMNVPTTLLAQVDAAIGGKSALDVDGVKNQVGVIRQPRFVAVDPAFVDTLPDPSFRSGLGELAKSALLAGGALHALVVDRAPAILVRDRSALADAILLALRFKAAVIVRDPLDLGERAILNAGHSAGHVIEAEALRRGVALSHGEAVAIGLVVEARAAGSAGLAEARRVLGLLALPAAAPFGISEDAARALLERDKKHRAGNVAVPVIESPGRVVLRELPVSALASAIGSRIEEFS